MILTQPETIYKADSFSLEGTLESDMTGWKIRCELYDESGSSVKLATANSGGSDADVEITDEANGVFVINVAKDATKNFKDTAYIEIQVETADVTPKEYTIHKGEIPLETRQIHWDEP